MQGRVSIRLRAALLAAALVAIAGPALAQFDRGQIAGIVKDETGGVIPGASVTATNVETRLSRTVVTDATGYYIVTALPRVGSAGEGEVAGLKIGSRRNVGLGAGVRRPFDAQSNPSAVS